MIDTQKSDTDNLTEGYKNFEITANKTMEGLAAFSSSCNGQSYFSTGAKYAAVCRENAQLLV